MYRPWQRFCCTDKGILSLSDIRTSFYYQLISPPLGCILLVLNFGDKAVRCFVWTSSGGYTYCWNMIVMCVFCCILDPGDLRYICLGSYVIERYCRYVLFVVFQIQREGLAVYRHGFHMMLNIICNVRWVSDLGHLAVCHHGFTWCRS